MEARSAVGASHSNILSLGNQSPRGEDTAQALALYKKGTKRVSHPTRRIMTELHALHPVSSGATALENSVFGEAIDAFSAAISFDGTCSLFFGARSDALLRVNDRKCRRGLDLALADAERCHELLSIEESLPEDLETSVRRIRDIKRMSTTVQKSRLPKKKKIRSGKTLRTFEEPDATFDFQDDSKYNVKTEVLVKLPRALYSGYILGIDIGTTSSRVYLYNRVVQHFTIF